MTDVREAAVAWVRTALEEEMPGEKPNEIEAAAEVLHNQAVEFDVPIENLVRWIHEREQLATSGVSKIGRTIGAWVMWCKRIQ